MEHLPLICLFIFIAYYLFCLYVKDFGVSWIKPQYCVVPYPIRNHDGKLLSYVERYTICRRVPFCFKEYIFFYNNNAASKRYYWTTFHKFATEFDDMYEAELVLNDILNNPHKYLFQGHYL